MACCSSFPSCIHHQWYMETQAKLRRSAQERVWEMSVQIPQSLGGGNSHFTYKPGDGWHVTTAVKVPGVGNVSEHNWLKDFKF